MTYLYRIRRGIDAAADGANVHLYAPVWMEAHE